MLTPLPNNFFAVQVPPGFMKREIVNCLGGHRIKTSDRVGDYTYSETLPRGQWEIVGMAGELMEWDWDGIVEPMKLMHYKNYQLPDDHPNWGANYNLTAATESGFTLLSSLSLTIENSLIIKKA